MWRGFFKGTREAGRTARWVTLAALLLPGCAPIMQQPARTPHLDLSSPPPDIVIFSVSGRCGPPCEAPRDNWDYLGARGTVDVLAQAFEHEGYRVEVATYADNALASYQSVKARAEQHGFAALVSDFDAMKAAWFGRPGAPRLVLLGHSHGVVWTHQLARLNPYVPFALQVDLDGICTAWQTDNAANLAKVAVDRPSYSPALKACELVQVGPPTQTPGQAPQTRRVSAKDIVWPNVLHNLEVQSKRRPARDKRSDGLYVNYLFDPTDNVRPDGSETGIERFVSAHEDHSSVSYPDSDAMAWVTQKSSELAAEWRVSDSKVQPPPVPPVPPVLPVPTPKP